jgi:hypothetical protein
MWFTGYAAPGSKAGSHDTRVMDVWVVSELVRGCGTF